MILETIKGPEDLKEVKEKNLCRLCQEIRDYIEEVVHQNGGHLASNLGVVELTVALHRSFDLPKDKIIFDVGHQSYTHKILTGRYEDFKTLRQDKGLSGFPKREESIYDAFDTGHSSTSISAALGIATARDLKGEDFYVVAHIGDGALTGGMALEAMNHTGHLEKKMIVLLNDNEMSIAENIGGISRYLSRVASRKGYRMMKQRLNVRLAKTAVGRAFRRALSRIKGSIKYLFSKKGIFFEQMGFTYLGPFDGHDIIGLEEGFRTAKMIDGPVLMHVMTTKGKGSDNAEVDPEKYHGLPPINGKKVKQLTAFFGEKLVELAKNNNQITAITAAMPSGTGLGLFRDTYPDRFFDVSIAEQHGLTFAAGQAAEGFHPVVAIYSTFMQRGVDQVIHDICMQNLPVTIVMDRAGLVGEDGETHQGVFDISLFGSLPNLCYMEPKNGLELQEMLAFAVEHKGPVMIRYPKAADKVYEDGKQLKNPIVLGQMEPIIENGNKHCIVTLGTEWDAGQFAYEGLCAEGIQVDLINSRFITPISETWINKLNKYEKIITIENHVKIGGFGSLLRSKLDVNGPKVYNLGLPNVFIQQGSVKDVRERIKFTKEDVLDKVRACLND